MAADSTIVSFAVDKECDFSVDMRIENYFNEMISEETKRKFPDCDFVPESVSYSDSKVIITFKHVNKK